MVELTIFDILEEVSANVDVEVAKGATFAVDVSGKADGSSDMQELLTKSFTIELDDN